VTRRQRAACQIVRLAGSALRFLFTPRPRPRRERSEVEAVLKAETERLRREVADLEEQVALITSSTSAETLEAYKDRIAELQRQLEDERERTRE